MTIEVTFWQAVTLLITFFGCIATFGRMLLAQIDRRMEEMKQDAKEDEQQWKRVERDLLNWRAEMPLHYVRREDYIRGQTVLESKMDALAEKLENVKLRGVINGG